MPDDDLICESKQVMEEIPAPELPYLPGAPTNYNPAIGLIGCGGVTAYHLEAYKTAGYNVAALCDVDEKRLKERQEAFYPDATAYADYKELLNRDDIEVVDIATHPETRTPMIEAALGAGKHVLSQKPFVLDLDVGKRLADLADVRGLKLAVNQNGRWAPHLSYMRHAIAAGLLGEVNAAHFAVHWDHSWTAGTVFDEIPHLVLYDFGIHWFDTVTCFMGERQPERVYASVAHAAGQKNKVPMLAQAAIEYDGAQASLVFDAATPFGASDEICVVGTQGTLASAGPDINEKSVTLYTADGYAVPALEGVWFRNGFQGTMAELLCAIEEGRQPYNSARDNLRSLALCFAAVASADDHEPKVPGEVRRMPRF